MNVRTIVLVLGIFALLSTATGGYLQYHSAKESAAREIKRELILTSEALKDNILDLISLNQSQVRILAGFEQIQEALLNQNPEALLQANRILDHFAENLAYDVGHLMDSSGNTIASSNRNQTDSFVGHNYSFRPHFIEAIQGRPSIYLAVGVTSGTRGLYFSYPVYREDGSRPIGVAVIKVSTHDLDSEFSRVRTGTELLVDKSGMIFVSNREDWTLNLLWRVSPEELSQIAETQQFGEGPWNWTGLEKKADNHALGGSGEEYLFHEMSLENCPGWRIVSLYSVKEISGKFVDPMVGKTGYVALILFVLVGGAVVVLYVMAQKDIRSRKHAEEELRQREQILHSILSAAPIGIIHTQDKRIKWANQAWETMFGFEHEHEYVDKPTSTIHPSEAQYEQARQTLYEHVNPSGVSEAYATLQRGDGRHFDAHLRTNFLDPTDTTMGRITAITNISERRVTEEALRLSEEKYRILVEKALEGIAVAQDGVLRFANREGSNIIGYDPEELLGQQFMDFIHPDHAEMVLQRHIRRLKGEQFPSRYSFKILRKDGNSRWIEIDSGLISWDGQPATLFFMSDITERKQMEDELRQSSERYMSLYSMMRLMCDNVPDLIWAKDLERRFLFVNRAVCEKLLCAKDTEEPVGKTDMFFVQRERSGHLDVPNRHTFGEICIDSDVVVMGTREPQRFDEFGNVKGEFLYLDVYKAPFWNEQAEMIGTVGCGRDVTRERRIEDSLRESEARYRDLFEYASDLIYTLDLAGNFTSVNGIVRSLLGFTADEFLTLNFRDIVDPQSLQTTEENFLRKVRDGVETTGPYEILVRTKEGTFVWLEVTSRIIRQEGNPVGIHGIARNITLRKELEAAVHEAQMKYQSVVEAFDGVIHISSPNYEIEFANQRLIERTGYDPVGKKCYGVLHGLNEVCPWCIYEKASREETFRRERFSPKDNRWYYVVSSPMVHQDGSMSRIFLMQDIDELKRSEEERENLSQQLIQAQKMEAVGTLAGGIAHDFNNLLQVVLGYSQLLLAKKSPNSPEYDNVKKITVAARHAADLVKGLLAFSRKAITRPRPLDLNHQVTEVKSLLERTIPKMIKIELRLEEDLPVIHADPGQIEQILMNLGVNARDAMLDGGVLTIETSNVLLDQDYTRNHIGAKPGRHVMLLVSDTGQGIDKETLEHIFEPFYTTKDVGKGTGLGLSMVYGIVKQHNGYISCESQPGHGTTFRIYFPAVEKEEEEHEQVDVSSPPGGFETLLMVDDEEVVRELGSDYLRQAGYTVLTASNGREALEVYQEKQADVCLVLLDLIMPEMGGRKCFEELLKINPKVKVLIVSGYTSGGTEKDAVELGARGFVEKPYDLTKLLQVIRDVLDED